jgi:follistatin-related protein 5
LLKVQIQPVLQVESPNATAEIRCNVVGEPVEKVEWLKNDEPISATKGNKYEIIGKGRLLRIKNLVYADTGAYMCRAGNVGGLANAISSLVVQENPTASE